ncbi:hypothetical protein D3C71_2022280 [compost metagenome]
MPAIPKGWSDVSFENLRAEGAFLLSLKRTGGQVEELKIVAEKGGQTKLKLPFKTWYVAKNNGVVLKNTEDGFLTLTGKPGGEIVLKNGYE